MSDMCAPLFAARDSGIGEGTGQDSLDFVESPYDVRQPPHFAFNDGEAFAYVGVGDRGVVQQQLHVAQRSGDRVVRVVPDLAHELDKGTVLGLIHYTALASRGGSGLMVPQSPAQRQVHRNLAETFEFDESSSRRTCSARI